MAISRYRYETGSVTVPDDSGIANATGQLSHATGSDIITGDGSAVFLTEVEVNDYLLMGDIIRKVKHIYADDKIVVTVDCTTTAGPINFKVIKPHLLVNRLEAIARNGNIDLYTEEYDAQNLTQDQRVVWQNIQGISPIRFKCAVNEVELIY